MFYGLSYLEPELMADKITEIIAYGPCFVVDIESDMIITDSFWKYAIMDYFGTKISLDHVYQFGNGVSFQTVEHYN